MVARNGEKIIFGRRKFRSTSTLVEGERTDSLIARKELRARATLDRASSRKREEEEEACRRCRGFYRGVYSGGHPRSRGFILQEAKKRGGKRKKRDTKQREKDKKREQNGRVPGMIRLFYRTVFSLLRLLCLFLFLFLLSCLSSIFLSSRTLDSPNYSPGYTFSGFHELRFGEPPLSHLESNRGPLSKKLISLNIILGASGSRRALTDPSVHTLSPRPPQNPLVSAPRFVSAPRTQCPPPSRRPLLPSFCNRFAPFHPMLVPPAPIYP